MYGFECSVRSALEEPGFSKDNVIPNAVPTIMELHYFSFMRLRYDDEIA